jgi:hypothetical protein
MSEWMSVAINIRVSQSDSHLHRMCFSSWPQDEPIFQQMAEEEHPFPTQRNHLSSDWTMLK